LCDNGHGHDEDGVFLHVVEQGGGDGALKQEGFDDDDGL